MATILTIEGRKAFYGARHGNCAGHENGAGHGGTAQGTGNAQGTTRVKRRGRSASRRRSGLALLPLVRCVVRRAVRSSPCGA